MAGMALAALVFTPVSIRAGEFDFGLSAGYSHAFDTNKLPFHSKDGGYIDADFAWQLPTVVPVSVGFGLTSSGYYDSQKIYPGFGNTYGSGYGYYDNRLYSDVSFIEFEPRIAVTLWSTAVRGLFLKPRFGLGVLVDNYNIDRATYFTNYAYVDTIEHTGAAFEIRPAVQVGYAWGQGEAGIEASYMPAWGDFGKLGSSVQELRVGGFYTFRF